ncbi:MAG: hypothetical protein ABI678_27240 [Kofleriaceae bacterium]
MKTLLWLTAAAGAVLATAAAISSYRRRAPRAPLALAGGPRWLPITLDELVEARVIEIVPLDVSGPLVVDEATTRMLEELADQALFLK